MGLVPQIFTELGEKPDGRSLCAVAMMAITPPFKSRRTAAMPNAMWGGIDSVAI